MTVEAMDNRGARSRYTNVTVIISVMRSQYPYFDNGHYSFSISEREVIGQSVFRVTAVDDDIQVHDLNKTHTHTILVHTLT
jgi:hypothetical protein